MSAVVVTVKVDTTNAGIIDATQPMQIVANSGIGPAGPGVPAGGTTGQVLAKASDDDYDDEWITNSGGGSGLTNPLVEDLDGGGFDISNVTTFLLANGFGFFPHTGGNGIDTNGTVDMVELRTDSIVLGRSVTDTGLIRDLIGGLRVIQDGLLGPTTLVLSSPDATAYRLSVANDGTPSIGVDASPAAWTGASVAQLNAEVTARNAAIATAVAGLVNSAPGVLDTLKELADAIGDDPSFAATVTGLISAKISASTLTTDGDLLTRAAGVAARLTRAALAGDTAFTSAFAKAAVTGTASALAASNPVLALGQAGWTTDLPRVMKLGDGTTAWNSLPSFVANRPAVLAIASSSTSDTSVGTSSHDYPGVQITVSCDGTSAIALHAFVPEVTGSAAGTRCRLTAFEGATAVAICDSARSSATAGDIGHMNLWSLPITPSVGDHTYKLNSAAKTSGTVDLLTSSFNPVFIRAVPS